MRLITAITTSRADYGIYRSIFNKIENDHELDLELIVSGTHLLETHGFTVSEIEADGYTIGNRINVFDTLETTPASVARAISVGVEKFAEQYSQSRPDILLVLGDRFEMHAAVLAALPFKIPVAHIHGGELTMGAFDDALRHSITKLSHLHFVATGEYANRVAQLGEELWRIVVSGAPALDALKNFVPIGISELEKITGLRMPVAPLIVTFHPVTMECSSQKEQVQALLEVINLSKLPTVFTAPNIDPGREEIIDIIDEFVRNSCGASVLCTSLGAKNYFSLMSNAIAMIGNSSSGIVEAASFGLPVVNIGTRQEGRIRGQNVIDTGVTKDEILTALTKAISPEFKNNVKNISNPYVQGCASSVIVHKLKTINLDRKLIKKCFQNWVRPS